MHCVFCEDVHRAGDLVFEDERIWVVLHDDWAVPGHAMIVAKRHAENASSLEEEEWLHVARTWHRAERAILEATGAGRAIMLKLGIMTPHLHLHLYPVTATASRADVFDAFDAKTKGTRDEALVEEIRRRLRVPSKSA